jgi:hypothetical protein
LPAQKLWRCALMSLPWRRWCWGSRRSDHAPRSRPDQTRPDQTRPDQTRPDQTRPDQTRPAHDHMAQPLAGRLLPAPGLQASRYGTAGAGNVRDGPRRPPRIASDLRAATAHSPGRGAGSADQVADRQLRGAHGAVRQSVPRSRPAVADEHRGDWGQPGVGGWCRVGRLAGAVPRGGSSRPSA